MTDHQPLPVQGYTAQPTENINAVNGNKLIEEQLLRLIEELAKKGADPRWLAVGRTHIEEGFMALNRAIMKPQRLKLPGDPS